MKRKIYNELLDNGSNLRVCFVGGIRGDRVLVEEEFGMNLHETSMKCLTKTNEFERTSKPKNRRVVVSTKSAVSQEDNYDWYSNNEY